MDGVKFSIGDPIHDPSCEENMMAKSFMIHSRRKSLMIPGVQVNAALNRNASDQPNQNLNLCTQRLR
ncbi:CLUMA_CG000312, isoform A [Clunio marinus]|uniref:CLUMA_CG000312, isoform A n=1 Tax=Clunio marinus TaxID=568069 RepID=A0A1J1HDW9_9DIPT|nr:CLUMA_CG000312, isoform A [Clunio marinus]